MAVVTNTLLKSYFALGHHLQVGEAINLADTVQAAYDQANQVQQNVIFGNDSPIIAGVYVGGRYKWDMPTILLSASVVCTAPTAGDIQFTLEVGGALTGSTMLVAMGQTSAELNINTVVNSGKYIRWKCTSAPAPEFTAAMVQISTSLKAMPGSASIDTQLPLGQPVQFPDGKFYTINPVLGGDAGPSLSVDASAAANGVIPGTTQTGQSPVGRPVLFPDGKYYVVSFAIGDDGKPTISIDAY